MILGTGNDIVDIRRIEALLARFGARFEQRIFTDVERHYATQNPSHLAAIYAKRFAAKEACAKALGTGAQHGIRLRDMEVYNLPNGAPNMRLVGAARDRLLYLAPHDLQPQIHLSLSDEYPYAVAHVIISADPA